MKRHELKFLTVLGSSEFDELCVFVKTGERPRGQPITSLWLAEKLRKTTSEITALLGTLSAHDETIKELSKRWEKLLTVESGDQQVDAKFRK